MGKSCISFVIPTLNEEKHIGGVIDSIRRNMENLYDYEIIVVDNGSVDRTVGIARKRRARVLLRPNLTIGALRNAGATVAKGEILVFIDADVFLSDNWGKSAANVIEQLEQDPLIITGSTCGIQEKASWVEKYWYKPVLTRAETNYINSGHLIVTKNVFERIRGFSESLDTGEDYEFCQRAKELGAKILNNPSLRAVHEGYPRTVGEFFRRERWHGRGDYGSFSDILSSKPALISLIHLGFLIAMLVCISFYGNLVLLAVYFSLVTILCGGAAVRRCNELNISLVVCMYLYYIYFLARGTAFLDVLLSKIYNVKSAT